MLGVIGGTGLDRMPGLTIIKQESVTTPFGAPSAPLTVGEREGEQFVFLPRHGPEHHIPPHKINYRANIWALKEYGIGQILAVAAVGGIGSKMGPGAIVVPDQIIDYTYGREHTYYDGEFKPVEHFEFGEPYCADMRKRLIDAAEAADVEIVAHGCYGATQGPRLESAAEIRRMAQDGSDIVGMTGMPEAALAKELKLSYATCAVVSNWAAGIDDSPISMEEIENQLKISMDSVIRILMRLNLR
jgi:5'-methylthioinosine phosphorylase